MKKILLIAICLLANIMMANGFQQLDKAIRETNLIEVERLLAEKSITSKEAIILYLLAQEAVQLYYRSLSDRTIILTSTSDYAYMCGMLIGVAATFMGTVFTAFAIIDKINTNKDVKAAMIFATIPICGALIARKSMQKIGETQTKIATELRKLYNDALTIRGLILNQVDLVDIKI